LIGSFFLYYAKPIIVPIVTRVSWWWEAKFSIFFMCLKLFTLYDLIFY